MTKEIKIKTTTTEPEKPKERALCTVNLKDCVTSVPNIKDGKVFDGGENVEVKEYLGGLTDGILVHHVIFIGGKFKTFTEFFTDHVEWIFELRGRLPERGYGCKLNIIDLNGETYNYTWAEFCLKFFGVSADWVRKLQLKYVEMQDVMKTAKPGEEEPEEGEEKEIEPSGEAVEQSMEEKAERAETQASNLLHELGNLIAKILKYKDAVPEELVSAALAAKTRVLPPMPVGIDMDTEDESFAAIGTDELKKQMDEVLRRSDNTEDIAQLADDYTPFADIINVPKRRKAKGGE
jgi:hypothetical protein